LREDRGAKLNQCVAIPRFITFALDDTPVYAPVANMAELKQALEQKLVCTRVCACMCG
jgi:hypothetical protein